MLCDDPICDFAELFAILLLAQCPLNKELLVAKHVPPREKENRLAVIKLDILQMKEYILSKSSGRLES